jgi:hypothetical protein
MKRKIWILAALAVMVVSAEDRQPAKKASVKKTPAPPADLTLPAGATLVEPGTYTFTDAKGKKWIYRQTPFGLSRAEDKPAETTTAPAAASLITATEDGDTIRFERPGPFGVYKWQKKKSELAEDERAAWERSRAAKAKQE